MILLLFCYFYRTPLWEVCLNYEAVEILPQTLTNLYLGSAAYCYVAYLLDPTHPILLMSDVPRTELSSLPPTQQDNPSTRAYHVSIPAYQKYLHPPHFSDHHYPIPTSLSYISPHNACWIPAATSLSMHPKTFFKVSPSC